MNIEVTMFSEKGEDVQFVCVCGCVGGGGGGGCPAADCLKPSRTALVRNTGGALHQQHRGWVSAEVVAGVNNTLFIIHIM